jgi:hypothetical protein
MLLIDGCVQWCNWSPTPQFVFRTISMLCERQTRSSREDSPGFASSGGPSSFGWDGSATLTTIRPPIGIPGWPPSVRLPMYA